MYGIFLPFPHHNGVNHCFVALSFQKENQEVRGPRVLRPPIPSKTILKIYATKEWLTNKIVRPNILARRPPKKRSQIFWMTLASTMRSFAIVGWMRLMTTTPKLSFKLLNYLSKPWNSRCKRLRHILYSGFTIASRKARCMIREALKRRARYSIWESGRTFLNIFRLFDKPLSLHGISKFASTISSVIFLWLLKVLQSHGQQGFACTISHVMLGFSLK